MDRRSFLTQTCLGSAVGGGVSRLLQFPQANLSRINRPPVGVHSITPVIGDGKWIWNDPPENEKGFLEPRSYDLEVGIELEGNGSASRLRATTPIPVELPEQTIDDLEIQNQGTASQIHKVSGEAAQLTLAANAIGRGQKVSATAKMKLTLSKQYLGFERDQFLEAQPGFPLAFRKQYLFDSPGIEVRAPQVRKQQTAITAGTEHPWDQAYKIYQWVWENIHARIGNYTSVLRALKSRVGDCEERAACFVAMCRSAGIPARLVWVPNHNWAEFFLVDSDGQGHWIPAHTAAYSWFGWTGAHELVIQKGDNLAVPEKRQRQRLLADWAQWQGIRPTVRFVAHLRPTPNESTNAGPGERIKDRQGKWVLQGSHQLDGSLRDGPDGRRYKSNRPG